MTTCKICKRESHKIFSKIVMQKYEADYFKCSHCDFVQTSEPVWYEESYSSAITALDIGLIDRNLYLKEEVSKIIDCFFETAETMVDYGGGYGIFVRLMRDRGYDFYRQDIYCDNLFAVYFDITDTKIKKFDVLTTFEVFEHLKDPLPEIEKMNQLSGNIIFTTILYPSDINEFRDWWYVSSLTGQHIAFYSEKTLLYLAEKLNKHLYTNGTNLHVFSEKKISDRKVKEIFKISNTPSLLNKVKAKLFPNPGQSVKRKSLLQEDYRHIEKILINKR
jgi:hypothetical protein